MTIPTSDSSSTFTVIGQTILLMVFISVCWTRSRRSGSRTTSSTPASSSTRATPSPSARPSRSTTTSSTTCRSRDYFYEQTNLGLLSVYLYYFFSLLKKIRPIWLVLTDMWGVLKKCRIKTTYQLMLITYYHTIKITACTRKSENERTIALHINQRMCVVYLSRLAP